MILYHVKCQNYDKTIFHAIYLDVKQVLEISDRDILYDLIYINKEEVKSGSYEHDKFLELLK